MNLRNGGPSLETKWELRMVELNISATVHGGVLQYQGLWPSSPDREFLALAS